MLDESGMARAERRIGELEARLPLDWSDHLLYWRKLYEDAQGV
jgi:hypothetical protein